MKICSKCKNPKNLDEFGMDKNYKDGRKTKCKDCLNAYGRDLYHKNREPRLKRRKELDAKNPEKRLNQRHVWISKYRDEYNASQRKWRHENRDRINAAEKIKRAENKDHEHELHKDWYQKHKDRLAKERKERYEKHHDTMREYWDNWRKANPEKVKAQSQRSYKRNIPQYREKNRARYAKRRGADICDLTRAEWEHIKAAYGHRCVYCGKKPKQLTQDHIIPIANGGNHTASNVVPACRSCNSSKGIKPAPVFQQALFAV